jgi:hypothetical protein
MKIRLRRGSAPATPADLAAPSPELAAVGGWPAVAAPGVERPERGREAGATQGRAGQAPAGQGEQGEGAPGPEQEARPGPEQGAAARAAPGWAG